MSHRIIDPRFTSMCLKFGTEFNLQQFHEQFFKEMISKNIRLIKSDTYQSAIHSQCFRYKYLLILVDLYLLVLVNVS